MKTGTKAIRRIMAIVVVSAAFLVANNARALIDLGITTGQPADLASELARLNGQIAIYNAAHDPDLPAAVLAGNSGQIDTPAGPTSIDLDVTGWTYLKLKWGEQDQFYYVGDESGVFSFHSAVFVDVEHSTPEGLSHYVFYNPTTVPDGASSMVLLGLALVSTEVFRRKFAKG